MSRVLKVRAEIKDREFLEFSLELSEDGRINSASVKARGCARVLEASQRAASQAVGKDLESLEWNGADHSDVLIREAFLRARNQFVSPILDAELCHCRKIPTEKVDEAIVLGAHTPEKVRAWTSAGSGCGTCRPETEKLISFRLSKKAS